MNNWIAAISILLLALYAGWDLVCKPFIAKRRLDRLRQAWQRREQERIAAETSKLQQLIDYNKSIVQSNMQILKSNAVETFAIQESSVYLSVHYKQVIEALDLILDGSGVDRNRLFDIRDTARHNLNFVNNKFANKFGLSIEDYQRKKLNIIAQRQDGQGDITISNHSIN